ncbi:unnamed protein product [Durusdinium trenchii]|uniref:Protein FAM221A n=2 Tax=Durusdinium trenchii TaxID=1381693 RepID=A0ABP0JM47_9DINO
MTRRRRGHSPHGLLRAELRRAYRAAARRCHPDKQRAEGQSESYVEGGSVRAASEEFLRLQEALELLLHPPSSAPSTATTCESERLDKHFFGTQFGSDSFDPRAWLGEAALTESPERLLCVWRCKSCPEPSSVCCRLKLRKHLCFCGHKVEAHLQKDRPGCIHPACRCQRLEFYVQQLGWEARCSCKHHIRDHQQLNGQPFPCSKRLPGKDKKPCPCKGFNISWVCTCGHPASEHESTWQLVTSKAAFAREWVAQGLRPECVAEAEEKRARWQQQAADRAARSGGEVAREQVKAQAQRMQISMCAEAKMLEAVEQTLDGRRLPRSASTAVTKPGPGCADGRRLGSSWCRAPRDRAAEASIIPQNGPTGIATPRTLLDL